MIISSRCETEQPGFTFSYSVCRFSRISYRDRSVNAPPKASCGNIFCTAAFTMNLLSDFSLLVMTTTT